VTSPAVPIDLAAVVRAVDALVSPLEWGSRHAWLAESLTRVREARGVPGCSGSVASVELEELLRLDGDEPGWLQAALDSPDEVSSGSLLPRVTAASEECLPLVSMRCALAAGLAILRRLDEWLSMLGHVCDDVNAGMAIFRREGLEQVVRNERWDELLDDEPQRDRLRELITRQAGHTAASVGSMREDYVELELSGGSYRLIAKRAPAGTLLPDAGVLVLMDRVGPDLPTTRELRVSFGLRGREPQVALLAAEGLSNAAIAQRMRLSAHTVRHYLERVLTRLGLHSRKALALHLMAAERDKATEHPGGKTPR
jgi:DNA-binding CsgD family transcriptional regulator